MGDPKKGNQQAVLKSIRNMARGSTCTYKLKAICGAPAFGAFEATDTLASKLDSFNITITEFEFEQSKDFG